MSRLSVVLPAYNEEQILAKTCRTLKEILSFSGIEYELVFVDDGSSDKTWNVIEKVSKEDRNISGIHFSRNFGKEAAIIAGLAQASGDAVAVMDCDLQHPPETLVKMFLLWRQGFEVIEGVKKSRGKESRIHGKSAGFFYRIMSGATGFDMKNASDFKLLDRKAVESVLSMPERNMFFRAASSWVGFKSTSVPFEVQEREAGETKWSTRALIGYAFRNIVSFTTIPLQFVTAGAGACFLFADSSYIFSDTVFYRTCSRRVYDPFDCHIVYWQCNYAEPWNYRILYCQNLRRGKASAEIYRIKNYTWRNDK